MSARRPSQDATAASVVAGLQPVAALTAGAISVQKFSRGDGEVVWRHPQNRIVLPLTGADVRNVTVQLEGGRSRDFVWHNSVGFYPAETKTQIVTTAATSFQLLWSPDPEGQGSLEPLVPFDDPFIALNARAIADELDGGVPDRLFIESLGNAIVIRLRRHCSPCAVQPHPVSGLSRERLNRVLEFIDAHLDSELTLQSMASIACLSPHHLSRSFRRAMGVGLHRYVTRRRMERARWLILSTDRSFAEIAWAVGFEGQAAFTTRFRREMGQTPGRLRRAR